ncbi:MAG: MFS transporter [Caldilineaceae bacterium]|nr:MFS transporter [Caldilineaceae bacterium]
MSATTLTSSEERIDYAAILPHNTKLVILTGVLLSLFLAAIDQTIVATALPAIVADFNAIDMVSWVSTGYLLASTAMVPVYGKLSDLYGRKIILLWGIIVFLLGSALCGLASSMFQLIFYRVIQGIGAAALTSTAFAIPADLFAPADRPRYMGIFGSVFGLASVIGPFIGGFLTDQISWHWVFYVNLPLGAIALAFVTLKMPRLASGVRGKIDWLGTLLLILAVVPFMLGLTLDKTLYPWSSPLIVGMLGLAAVATVLFLLVEMRVSSPIISLGLFRNRTFAVGIVASVLNGAAFFGAILFLSLFMVNVLGLSATEAGTAQIPLMLAFVVSSNVFSQIVQRVGRYKSYMLVGFLVMLIGFLLLTQIGVHTTMWGVTWRMFIVGLGMGPALPLLNLAMQNAVSFHEIGAATASRQFFQQLGQAIGAAVFGVVLATTLTTQIATNVAPILSDAPPALQATLDPAQFRSSISGGEGAGESQINLEEQILAAASTAFTTERELVTAALTTGDDQARTALLSSPSTEPALKELLTTVGQTPQLEQALAIVDQAQQAMIVQAQTLATEVTAALRLSFANSITRIYFYATGLVVIAFLLIIFWLPELPLRRSNRMESAAPILE